MSDVPDDSRPRIRLLIIDDEAEVRTLMKDLAGAHALDVSEAGSVDDALEQLAAGLTIDVVLCDVAMPDGGAEKWLRVSHEAHPELERRTIVMTGWAPPGIDETLPGAPPDRCLYKPFTMTEVRAIADRLVATHASRLHPGAAGAGL